MNELIRQCGCTSAVTLPYYSPIMSISSILCFFTPSTFLLYCFQSIPSFARLYGPSLSHRVLDFAVAAAALYYRLLIPKKFRVSSIEWILWEFRSRRYFYVGKYISKYSRAKSHARFPDIKSCTLVADTDDSEVYTVAIFRVTIYSLFI
jgi:hypothetical protein